MDGELWEGNLWDAMRPDVHHCGGLQRRTAVGLSGNGIACTSRGENLESVVCRNYIHAVFVFLLKKPSLTLNSL